VSDCIIYIYNIFWLVFNTTGTSHFKIPDTLFVILYAGVHFISIVAHTKSLYAYKLATLRIPHFKNWRSS